jgi:hypothetical protein
LVIGFLILACELVTSPSIIFLDEPTSGLDAYNAYTVIECLVALARDFKRTVICTIHQPRSNIYALFDQLILLGQGRVVYSGPAQQAVLDHFSSLGYSCPLGFNIADYLVDLTMHACKFEDTTDDLSSAHSRKSNIRDEQEHRLYSPGHSALSPGHSALSPDSSIESLLTSRGTHISTEFLRIVKGYILSPISARIRADMFEAINIAYPTTELLTRARLGRTTNELSVAEIHSTFCGPGIQIKATWATQFQIISGRTFRNLVRNPELLKAHYFISVVVALISGLLFWQCINKSLNLVQFNMAGIQNRLGLMTFITALFAFQCLSSMQIFASERLVFVRERANRYYSPITYFLSKVKQTLLF